MKRKICAIIFMIVSLFIVVGAFATFYTFEWDANTETDLAGYRLYQSVISGQYTFSENNVCSNDCIDEIPVGVEMTDYDVPPGNWFYVLTAFDWDGNESGPSNEVTASVPLPPDTTPPNNPTGLFCFIRASSS